MAKQPRIIPAYQPAPYDEYICNATRAMFSGNASEGQQKAFMRWLIEDCCLTYDQPFRPGQDGERDTAFACGRMFVGQQIRKVAKLVTVQKESTKA